MHVLNLDVNHYCDFDDYIKNVLGLAINTDII